LGKPRAKLGRKFPRAPSWNTGAPIPANPGFQANPGPWWEPWVVTPAPWGSQLGPQTNPIGREERNSRGNPWPTPTENRGNPKPGIPLLRPGSLMPSGPGLERPNGNCSSPAAGTVARENGRPRPDPGPGQVPARADTGVTGHGAGLLRGLEAPWLHRSAV